MAAPASAAQGRRRDSDWRLLQRIVPYARRNKRLLAVSLLFLFPPALAGALQPVLIGQAISLVNDEAVWGWLDPLSLRQGIYALAGLLLATILVRLMFDALQGYLVQRFGQQVTAGIREDLFAHVTALASRFFDRTPVGRLVTRLTSDVETLGDVFSSGAIGILSDIVRIAVLLVVMFARQWQLAGLLLLMLLPVSVLIVRFQQRYRQANYTARQELSTLNATLAENLAGINIVQLFRRERLNSEQFRATNTRYIRAVQQTIFYDANVSATLEWFGFAGIAAVLGVGGQLVVQGGLTLGTLSAFILFSQRLFEPLRQFADKFTLLQSGFTGIERISEIANEPIEIADPHSRDRQQLARSAPGRRGEIRFERVWFGYKPDEYVLQDLSFTIEPGERVAIVGPTGAGKSSVVRLLCRLYEPNHGRIRVDGIDIRQLPQAELRRHVGVILQENFLFAGTVRDNIALGEPYSLQAIEAAARLVGVHDFIASLPHGYETQLRERGTNLSGGQKQLLAFARVAVRDPRVVVLDEATASLDVRTEAGIQSALESLLADRSAIIIAHRLATIRNADRILVLQDGKLIEQGSHQALLRQGGEYARLYRFQRTQQASAGSERS